MIRCIVAYLAILCCGLTAHAQTISSNEVLATWLQQPRLQFGSKFINSSALLPLYAGRGYSPLWTDAQGLSPTAIRMLDLFEHARDHGLDPERYHLSLIRSIIAINPENGVHPLQIQSSLDLIISQGLMQYASDMRSGSTRPQWDAGASSLSSTQRTDLLQQAIQSSDAVSYFQALAPQTAQYKGLQQVYHHYRDLAAAGGWPEFAVGKEAIKAGSTDTRIPAIRDILRITEDLQETATNDFVYDAPTQQAVKRFQARHGLEANGALNAATQKALAVPVQKRLEQIEVSLERMRWMPSDLGTRYVLVNVPGYTLTARAGNDSVHMKVIVGKRDTKTPLFSKQITQVVLNPSWGVPQKIAAKEMLPKIRKNPEYLVNAGYTLTQTSGGRTEEVDPRSVDWSTVSASHFPYSLRQNPGEDNALGKVKFTIPDSDSIYLHDTANRHLFSRDFRSLSHGCIRLAEPKEMAKFVLRQEGWNQAKIDAAYDSEQPKTVPVTPLPVHLVYWTSWVDGASKVHFGEDIYRMDESLVTAMRSAPAAEETVKLAFAK